MSEEEYEVECILRAHVVSRKGGKKVWSYYVKWKGYDAESDNTWEPPESFTEGSQHFIESFWNKVGEARDYRKMSLFKLDEEIFPKGPPKRVKPKARADGPIPHSLSDVQDDSDYEVPESDDEVPVPQRKRRGTHSSGAPASKRLRSHNEGPTPSTSKRATAAKNRSIPANAVGSGTLSDVEKPSTRSSTAPKNASKTSTKNLLRNRSSREPIEVISDSEESDRELNVSKPIPTKSPTRSRPLPPPVQSPSEPDPALRMSSASSPKSQSGSAQLPLKIGPPRGVKPRPSIPAHRAREANPRVKMMDQPFTRIPESDRIDTKAKLTARMGEESGVVAQAIQPDIPTSRTRVGKFKVGPGRSSVGLQLKKTGTKPPSSSPGGPIIVPRKPNGSTSSRKNRNPPPTEKDESVAADASTHDVDMQDAEDAEIPNVDEPALNGLPDGVVAGDEVLQSAGLEIKEAQELPDFVKDQTSSAPLPSADADKEVEEVAPSTAGVSNEPIVIETTKPKSAPGLTTFGSAWKQTTIFGPLGIGYGDSLSKASTPPAPVNVKPTFLLALDTAISVPVILKDISPPTLSTLKPLDEVVTRSTRGPPGKFYQDDAALELVSALKSGGSCARIALDGGTEEQKAHYERVQRRLYNGELFVAMIGGNLLAFIACENSILAHKLGIPATLLGLVGNIVASEVVIENDAAYCDAVMKADTARW